MRKPIDVLTELRQAFPNDSEEQLFERFRKAVVNDVTLLEQIAQEVFGGAFEEGQAEAAKHGVPAAEGRSKPH